MKYNIFSLVVSSAFLATLALTLSVQFIGLALHSKSLTQRNILPNKILISELESPFQAAEQLRKQNVAPCPLLKTQTFTGSQANKVSLVQQM